MEEASRKAREQLPALREHLNKGLEPNEMILVKLPFYYDIEGVEWMWVEVVTWEGDDIKGILLNDPYYIGNLKAGSAVTGSMEDVFDYLHYLPDGTTLGNTTGEIILRNSR